MAFMTALQNHPLRLRLLEDWQTSLADQDHSDAPILNSALKTDQIAQACGTIVPA